MGFGRQFHAPGNVCVGEGAANRRAHFRVADRLEEAAAHDLERLLGGDRLPKGLDASECLFQGAERRDAALASGFDIGLGQ
jgi:hypothetical protein